MTMDIADKPERCSICGCFLTTVDAYNGSRCLDPAHWQAAGLNPLNFYAMARIMAIGAAHNASGDVVIKPINTPPSAR
jgi:hypothetical protein